MGIKSLISSILNLDKDSPSVIALIFYVYILLHPSVNRIRLLTLSHPALYLISLP